MEPRTGPGRADRAPLPPCPERRSILLVYEPGRRGAAALAHAHREVRGATDRLTVVTLAPQQPYVRCGPSGESVHAAVLDAARRDLAAVRRELGPLAAGASFRVLTGDADRALRQLVQRGGFDLVLAPGRGRRLSAPGRGQR